MHKIITNATIVTVDEQQNIYEQGAISFQDGIITYVGPTPTDLSQYDEVIDAKDKIVLPGLINTHGHIAMSLLRGYADDEPLETWLQEKIWPWEAKFTADDVKWGAALSIIEMIRTGTTNFVDMYDFNETIAEVVQTSGMRATISPGMIGLDEPHVLEKKLAKAISFVENWHDQAGGKIKAMLSPHSPYTCSPEFITQILDAATRLNVPVHTHMSETEWEVGLNVERYGERPVAHLKKLGMFDRPCLLAHAVHLTDDEIDVLAAHEVRVSHNVISNLKLASGIAPVPQMLAKGVSVSLGTDSSVSNNNLNLFEELKLAAMIHKGTTLDPLIIPAEKALMMATVHGAEAVFQEETLGNLKVGKMADFIMIDATQAQYQPAHNPISHLVYAANGMDVTDTVVQGEFLMKDQQLLTLDEELVRFEVNRAVQQLMQR